jgi:Rha family phage regulatory protein
MTTSRIVAKKFGKSHKHVIRNIKALTQCASRHNFVPTPFLDSQGKNQIEYTMDRRSYMLLALRFTSDEALKVQEAFINVFESSTYTDVKQELDRIRNGKTFLCDE